MHVYKNGTGHAECIGDDEAACLICGLPTRWRRDGYCRTCHEYFGDELPELVAPHPRHGTAPQPDQ